MLNDLFYIVFYILYFPQFLIYVNVNIHYRKYSIQSCLMFVYTSFCSVDLLIIILTDRATDLTEGLSL